jgi:hypothetical protein
MDVDVGAAAAAAPVESILDRVPSWTNMLLDMLEYTHVHQKAMGSVEMPAAAEGASRWRAIDPTIKPTEEDQAVLPGLYIKKADDKKKIEPPVRVRESVIRELQEVIRQKLGTTGVTLFSLEDDIPLIMGKAYREGIDAVGTDMGVGTDEHRIIGGVPLTTVEHDNEQLKWGRTSRKFPDRKVPVCINGKEGESGSIYMPCVVYGMLPGNQGALQTWMTPSQQHLFDDTGEVPPAGPCLLCIRAGLQELVLAYGNEINPMRLTTRKLVVPPFSILIDQPGGYRSQHCITPAESQVVTSAFPRNSGTLVVRTNERGDEWYVDQQDMVYNVMTDSVN